MSLKRTIFLYLFRNIAGMSLLVMQTPSNGKNYIWNLAMTDMTITLVDFN